MIGTILKRTDRYSHLDSFAEVIKETKTQLVAVRLDAQGKRSTQPYDQFRVTKASMKEVGWDHYWHELPGGRETLGVRLADRAAELARRRQEYQEREQAKRERLEQIRSQIEWLGVMDEGLGLNTAIYTSPVYGRVRLVFKLVKTQPSWNAEHEKCTEYVVDITAFYVEGDYSQCRSGEVWAPSVEEAVAAYIERHLR
jgi:hypothetical protein